uniref:Uncharacterized protein n=1 Tax=Amphimedon queenslandica TaxID=400682 RepID=A0A1X7V6Q0_AMPQE
MNDLHVLRTCTVAPFYLIYFDVDETVSLIKASDLVESSDTLLVGSDCHVKIKKKIYEGKVVTFGKFTEIVAISDFAFICTIVLYSGQRDEVENVQEQFLNKVYTPEFLQEENTNSPWDTIESDAASNSENNYSIANNKRKRKESNDHENQVKKRKKTNTKTGTKALTKSSKEKRKKQELKVVAMSSFEESSANISLPPPNNNATTPISTIVLENDSASDKSEPELQNTEAMQSLTERVENLEQKSDLLMLQIGPLISKNTTQGVPLIQSQECYQPLQLETDNSGATTATFHWVPPAPAAVTPVTSQSSPVPAHNTAPVHYFRAMASSQQSVSHVPCSPNLSQVLPQPAASPQPASSSVSNNLLHPDAVIQKYLKLRNLSNAGRLAVRLAYESYFGKDL